MFYFVFFYLFVVIDIVISNFGVVIIMLDCYMEGMGMNKFFYYGFIGLVVRVSCWVLIRNRYVSE